jgi:protein-S-isoprenylcysteine O-methyltransferase Ste14
LNVGRIRVQAGRTWYDFVATGILLGFMLMLVHPQGWTWLPSGFRWLGVAVPLLTATFWLTLYRGAASEQGGEAEQRIEASPPV